MSFKRSLWGYLGHPDEPPPALTARPYRDAALVHGVLAAVIVALGWATGTHVGRAGALAGGYFALATGWTWWRVRRRLHAASLREET
jgi:hypothetical protein